MKFNFRNVSVKVARLASLTLGIHFMVAHFKNELPFGLPFGNNFVTNFVTFVWAYTGAIIGVGFVIYGIAPLIEKVIDKFIERN